MSEDQAYKVVVLSEGYVKETQNGNAENCTCTLIRGPKNIIVNTMTAWDGGNLLAALKRQNLTTDDIDYVICTRGHSNHVGCNDLFLKSIHIVGYCIYHGDFQFIHNFYEEKEYKIDDYVKIIVTPGNSLHDTSVIVKSSEHGNIIITGDLFNNANDLPKEGSWENSKTISETHVSSRNRILAMADWIIPGYGPMFKVKDC